MTTASIDIAQLPGDGGASEPATAPCVEQLA